MKQKAMSRLWSIPRKIYSETKPPLDEIYHHGIKGQKWGVKNGPPYPLSEGRSGKVDNSVGGVKIKKKKSPEDFDPFKAMDRIDRSLSKKEQKLLGIDNNHSTDDIKFFFNKEKTAYLMTADYHGKYKNEHPIDGKIIGIAAMKKARGTGVTDKLIKDAKKEFSNERLVAEIDKENIASRKLFERNDFKKVMEEDYIDYYVWEKKK